MRKVTMKEAQRIEEELRKELEKISHMGCEKAKSLMKKHGFTFCEIGTGKSCYTSSKSVWIDEVTTKKYLNGTFLVVGTCNSKFGKGVIYKGYVIEVV